MSNKWFDRLAIAALVLILLAVYLAYRHARAECDGELVRGVVWVECIEERRWTDEQQEPTTPEGEHGTYRAFQRHKREGTRPCDACRKAAAEYQKAWRQKTGSPWRAQERLRKRATQRLIERHRAEWEALCDAERIKAELRARRESA